jgi:hypothetical protein
MDLTALSLAESSLIWIWSVPLLSSRSPGVNGSSWASPDARAGMSSSLAGGPVSGLVTIVAAFRNGIGSNYGSSCNDQLTHRDGSFA